MYTSAAVKNRNFLMYMGILRYMYDRIQIASRATTLWPVAKNENKLRRNPTGTQTMGGCTGRGTGSSD